MNNPDSKRKEIPDAPIPAGHSGNLLSSVAPPIELPNFITAAVPVSQLPPSFQESAPLPHVLPVQHPAINPVPAVQSAAVEDEKFSPAIPLSAGQPMSPPSPAEDAAQPQTSNHEFSPELDKIGDIMPGSGLITWMKGAVSSGGILHKVAEKAKSSVDTMITTLDPQMKEYLNSGGDMYIIVASDKENKVSPVREAFQSVFGKATVVGVEASASGVAAQPVGAAAALAAAKLRVAHVRATVPAVTEHTPVVAIEGFIFDSVQDRWYDTNLLLLTQPSLNIEVQIHSQCTPVPAAAAAALRDATPHDYPHKETGFALTIGEIMADNLQVPAPQWQGAATGVSRRELLRLSARALAGAYHRLLQVSAGDS